ncbi:MAG TPA: HD domain-containing protein [Candidatus Cloacimonadota bacterium]|nr:HD domain-containing protein [Candidatus Cloacimonadota bacterium]HPT72566.1 HD domain-containing protein [Candidatus Cloacimonadota bacterium]
MERIDVKNLKEYVNREIISYFLVSEKELREGAKDFFIRMKLTDKTGNVAANLWNNAKTENEKFKEGDVVKVKAMVILYKNQVQLTVQQIRLAESVEFDMADILPVTKKDVNQLADKLFSYIENITDSNIRALLKQFFDDKEFFTIFATSPAAKSWHHNFISGLLEHTVSVADICEFACTKYPLNKDILIAGALLHDIGKVYEYNQKSNIDFTDIGRLIGHLAIGDQMVFDAASKINNFPSVTLMKIRHLILSHHGEYEKASVRLPQTLEAIVLHFADNLDAQTTGVMQLLDGAAPDAEWSEFDRMNERYYFLG